MKKIRTFKQMPDGDYIQSERKSFGTTYIQNDKSGLMTGRKDVRSESGKPLVGDKTGVRRVKKDFILTKPGKIRGHPRKVYYREGEIVGRLPARRN